MKKTVSTWMLALVLVTGAFVSCSKDGDKPSNPNPPGGGDTTHTPPTTTYSIKMKVDGVQASYTSVEATIVADENDPNQITLDVYGEKSATSTEGVELVLTSLNGNPKAGEYVEGEHTDYGVGGAYAAEGTNDENAVFLAGLVLTPEAPFKIKITQITSDAVKGTFSGTFYDQNQSKKVITDGEFNVKITK